MDLEYLENYVSVDYLIVWLFKKLFSIDYLGLLETNPGLVINHVPLGYENKKHCLHELYEMLHEFRGVFNSSLNKVPLLYSVKT